MPLTKLLMFFVCVLFRFVYFLLLFVYISSSEYEYFVTFLCRFLFEWREYVVLVRFSLPDYVFLPCPVTTGWIYLHHPAYYM